MTRQLSDRPKRAHQRKVRRHRLARPPEIAAQSRWCEASRDLLGRRYRQERGIAQAMDYFLGVIRIIISRPDSSTLAGRHLRGRGTHHIGARGVYSSLVEARIA